MYSTLCNTVRCRILTICIVVGRKPGALFVPTKPLRPYFLWRGVPQAPCYVLQPPSIGSHTSNRTKTHKRAAASTKPRIPFPGATTLHGCHYSEVKKHTLSACKLSVAGALPSEVHSRSQHPTAKGSEAADIKRARVPTAKRQARSASVR